MILHIWVYYREKGNLDEALKYHKEAFEIYKIIENKQGEAEQLAHINIITKEKESPEEVLKHQNIKYLPDWNVPLTIWWDKKNKTVKLIDQVLLPNDLRVIECDNWKCLEEAIRTSRIRGLSAIGAAGAFALPVEAQRFEGDEEEFFKKMEEARRVCMVFPTKEMIMAVERVYNKLGENRGKK